MNKEKREVQASKSRGTVEQSPVGDKKLSQQPEARAPDVASNLPKQLPPSSIMQQSSSQRETQITPPSRLYSHPSTRPFEKDEYLLRLLTKGTKISLNTHLTSGNGTSTGFRVPEPVSQSARQANPSTAALPPSQAPLQRQSSLPQGGGSVPSCGFPLTAPGPSLPTAHPTKHPSTSIPHNPPSTIPPHHRSHQQQSSSQTLWSYADTEQAMGREAAASLRSAVIGHQVAFLEQVYDLHRALAVQRVLVKNCPQVHHVMTEAERILTSSSSQRDTDQPAAKRVKGQPADSRGRALHPDSQFAALPLSGETATGSGDGSGDDAGDADGSGGGNHGSGGGSTSPQPQVPLVPLGLQPPLQPAPSTASQTPAAPLLGWTAYGNAAAGMVNPMLWGAGLPPPPAPPNPMAFAAAAAAGMSGGQGRYPLPSPPVATPTPYLPGPISDPMAWWYYTYYGSNGSSNTGNSAGVGGAHPPANADIDAIATVPQQQHQQQQQQGAGTAALPQPLPSMPTSFLPPVQPPSSYKWWQDPQQTFGPAVDPAVLLATAPPLRQGQGSVMGPMAHAALLAGARCPPSATGHTGNGNNEVQSAPSLAGQPPDKRDLPTVAAAALLLGGRMDDQQRQPGKSKREPLVAPPQRRRKRKPADPIEEASSGTTGQAHFIDSIGGLLSKGVGLMSTGGGGGGSSGAVATGRGRDGRGGTKRGRVHGGGDMERKAVEATAAELLMSMNEKAMGSTKQ